MDDFNKQLHDRAVSEAIEHRKRILPADSTKDTTFLFVGGGIGGFGILLAARLLHIHGEVLQLLMSTAGFAVGCFCGHSVFDWFYVIDQSWQRPLFLDREYRSERNRWMGR